MSINTGHILVWIFAFLWGYGLSNASSMKFTFVCFLFFSFYSSLSCNVVGVILSTKLHCFVVFSFPLYSVEHRNSYAIQRFGKLFGLITWNYMNRNFKRTTIFRNEDWIKKLVRPITSMKVYVSKETWNMCFHVSKETWKFGIKLVKAAT